MFHPSNQYNPIIKGYCLRVMGDQPKPISQPPHYPRAMAIAAMIMPPPNTLEMVLAQVDLPI